MALTGADPRLWDLRQLCAAFEHQIRQGCKDESEWNRERQKLYAPPRPTASAPGRPAQRPKAQPMAVSDVSALLRSLGAEDAMYGTG